MKRENLYHHNKRMVKKSTSGSVRFVLVYDKNGKAYDCWDRPDLSPKGFTNQLKGVKHFSQNMNIIKEGYSIKSIHTRRKIIL